MVTLPPLLIDEKERFVIMVGCGMIIYNLAEPFEPYQYDSQTSQWRELFREAEDYWWIEGVTQQDENTFHFIVDRNSDKAGTDKAGTDKAGTYALRFPTLAIQKLR